MLRWKQFVQADIDNWTENTKKFTEQTGIKVRVDTESWEDIRPKAAVAANVGAGPDIIIGTNDDPLKFPDKLLDMTDLAEYLGGKYGGWYDVARDATACAATSGSHCRRAAAAAASTIASAPCEDGGLRRIPEGHRRLPEALPGAQEE